MSAPRKVVLLRGLEEPRDDDMRFRLTYGGALRSTQGDPRCGQSEPLGRALHKHDIRKVFHRQLKELWNTHRYLKNWVAPFADKSMPVPEYLASQNQLNGFRFVPLVRDELFLLCSLDVLFLRKEMPGGVMIAGDIDNRIKTLIDALRIPKGSELADAQPDAGEDPFFCLLEDDKQVTQLAVETDYFLGDAPSDRAEVDLVITVELRPYHFEGINLAFA